ncbi:MAG: hypothetical protein ACYC6O_10370 [Thermoleophilia bacterium]
MKHLVHEIRACTGNLKAFAGLLVAAALLADVFSAGLLITAAPALAAPAVVSPAAPSVAESADYSSEAWADPWDFSNGEDLSLTPQVQSWNVANLAMSGGNLSFDTAAGGFIEPVMTWGAFPHGRDSQLHTIDAGKYTHISFRMWSSVRTYAPIMWFSCDGGLPSCQGAMFFWIEQGWNTYDMQIASNDPNSPVPWAGQIKRLRLYPNLSTSSHVELDWMRLYQPGSNVNLSVQGSGWNEIWWDTDLDPGNNDPTQPGGKGAGLIGYMNGNGSISFPSSAYPPGSYYFYAKQSGQTSAHSSPLVVDAQPQPVILDPDITGAEDYATLARGDPWDFWQPTDTTGVANATVSWGGGLMGGSYGGSHPNDPQVNLPINGSIDASLYHRLTYRIYYDGPFGLADAPGGGMVARTIWTVNQGGNIGYHDSQDMVVVPGWQTVSVDLKTNPPSVAEDESSTNPIGWGGPASGTVSSIRFDPHEDPGGRTWYLDDIRLTRNDHGTPDFNIQFQDNSWEAGTTAELWADSDTSGYNGYQIASGISVSQGVNSYLWNGGGLPDWGIWYIHVKLTDPDGTIGRAYSTGPVDISPPPDAIPPTVSITAPSGSISAGDPTVTATVGDADPSSGINSGSATLSLNGGTATPCAVVGASISCPTSGLENGIYSSLVTVSDNSGNTGTANGSFTVTGQSYDLYSSYFTWYDNVGGSNWVLMSNPTGSADDITFDLAIAGAVKSIAPLSGQAVGQAHPGQSVFASYPGLIDGPVKVGYKAIGGTGDKALASQRVLWAGRSLEEVPATESTKLSDHFYWTWYDQQSPGYANWVMMANPGVSEVYYQITIAGEDPGIGSTGSIIPGGYAMAAFPGMMGGPVEVSAWSGDPDPAQGTPANIMASQRVLANYGGAFNEVPGIPVTELSSDYLWTWYDSAGAAGRNWIMVANPGSGPPELYYRITVGGVEEVQCDGPVMQNSYAFWRRTNLLNGPVELTTYSDPACTVAADSVASQRVVWGPSFEEVPGTPMTALADTYHWTWYDQKSAGAQNWVMVAPKPGEADIITVEVSFTDEGGTPITSGPHDIDPADPDPGNRRWYWTSPGTRGGPVQVTAYKKNAPGTPKQVIVSQRVLWNGYFNEVLGTVLN